MEEQDRGLQDYLAFMGRRKWAILATAAVVFSAAAATAFLLPSTYRSTATILIEEQEIPQDLVRSTVTSYADQRIQKISQQVMTRATLSQLIEKYNLYPTRRGVDTKDELLERVRDDILLDIVSADVIDNRSGRQTMATIAFTLSFDSEQASSAQSVANELVSLYLNANLRARQQKATETSTFLEAEAARLSQQLSGIESRLAQFKSRNLGRLPELVQLNLQLRDRTESELLEAERMLRTLEERRFYLDGQLAQVKPHAPLTTATGERVLDPAERLKVLESQYLSTAALYSADHPDVAKLRREIKALRQNVGPDPGTGEMAGRIAALRGELAAAQEKYGEAHPDVARLKRSLAALEQGRDAAPAGRGRGEKGLFPGGEAPENPAYITLKAQLDSTVSELATTRRKYQELKLKQGGYEARLAQTPLVEREYLDLTRDRENIMARYQEIRAKLMEAQVAGELEKESKGERFSLIDPPQLPELPYSPNRPAILLLGLILSLGGGVAYGAVLDGLDRSVRGPAVLAALGLPLLGRIPFIENQRDRTRRRRRRVVLATGSGTAAISVLLLLHLAWRPLDVVWFTLLRHLGV